MNINSIYSKKESEDGRHNIYNFFGIKIRSRKKYENIKEIAPLITYYRAGKASKASNIYDQMQLAVETAIMHQRSFQDLRYINSDKDVVLCSMGPTLDDYIPLEKAIHIGVKDVFQRENIQFDYLFHQDANGYKNKIIPSDFTMYRGNKCIKFIGNGTPFLINGNINQTDIRFYNSSNAINYQIDYLTLPDFCSTTFSAFSFALWTNPKRIFLVGNDCSQGHAICTKAEYKSDLSYLVNSWKLMKNFANHYYPNTEIISINPIGLKGMFKEIYTK